jgi:hypothetical protein
MYSGNFSVYELMVFRIFDGLFKYVYVVPTYSEK